MQWSAAVGDQVNDLKGHTDSVDSCSFSPDGRYLVTGSRDNTAILWDTQTGLLVGIMEGHKMRIMWVAYASTGKLIATASEDKTVVRISTACRPPPLSGWQRPVVTLSPCCEGVGIASR